MDSEVNAVKYLHFSRLCSKFHWWISFKILLMMSVWRSFPYESKILRKSWIIVSQLWGSNGIAYVFKFDGAFAQNSRIVKIIQSRKLSCLKSIICSYSWPRTIWDIYISPVTPSTQVKRCLTRKPKSFLKGFSKLSFASVVNISFAYFIVIGWNSSYPKTRWWLCYIQGQANR